LSHKIGPEGSNVTDTSSTFEKSPPSSVRGAAWLEGRLCVPSLLWRCRKPGWIKVIGVVPKPVAAFVIGLSLAHQRGWLGL
jgi:hypothetical protein